jgi:hypothetical protein
MAAEKSPTLYERLKDRFSKHEGLEDLIKMSTHWDGHKRENAVRRIGLLSDPIALPCLFVRVNDWVYQVRYAAKKSIHQLLTKENTGAFVICLPKLYHLMKCNRDSHGALIKSVEKHLLLEGNSHSLITGLSDDNPLVVRACALLIIKHSLLPLAELVILGLQHPDIIFRRLVANRMGALTGEALQSAIKIALKDHCMPVRREAFQLSLKLELSEELAEIHLFDQHTSIREIAIKYLSTRNVDVIMHYQKCLLSENVHCVRCAIWAFGHLNVKQERSTVISALSSTHISLRKESITALARLGIADDENRIVNCLLDDSPAVCKIAAKQLRLENVAFSAKDLLEVINKAAHEQTLLSCIGLAKSINKWERFVFLLSLLDNKYEKFIAIDQLASQSIYQWNVDFNRSSAQPTKMQLTQIKSLVSICQAKMSQNMIDSIAFTLNFYDD